MCKITVGISAYNIEKYLPRAIDSVLAQTHENLEIIIVDDGSTDGTGAICDRYAEKDKRIRVIHQENAGPGMARNRVMEAMTGDWLMFVDGDDYIEPDMAETMLKAAQDAACPLAICRYFEERDGSPMQCTKENTGDGSAVQCIKENTGDGSTVQCTNAQRTAPLCSLLDRDTLLTLFIEESDRYPIRNAVWNKLIRRELIEHTRMPGQMQYEDILFTTRLLAAAEQAVFVDRPLYHYIIDREDSIMNRGVNEGILTDQIPSYHAREAFLREIGREDLAYTESYLVCKKLLALYAETVWPYRDRKKVLTGKAVAELRTGITKVLRDYGKSFRQIYACRIADSHERFKMRLFLTHPVCYRLFTMLNDGFIRPMRGL